MRQKGFTHIILLLTIIAVVGTIGLIVYPNFKTVGAPSPTPEPIQTSSPEAVSKLPTDTVDRENIMYIDDKTVVTLSSGYKAGDPGYVIKDKTIYTWRFARGGGLCSFDEYESGDCGYTDESLPPTTNTFRIWKDKTGIIALNPQQIKVTENHYLDLVIQKEAGVFSFQEVEDWKTIIKRIRPTN